MKYLVLDNQDCTLARSLFGSSAWCCAAINARLASHLLGKVSRW